MDHKLDQKLVRLLFLYEDGQLIWRTGKNIGKFAGSFSGSMKYPQVGIKNSIYYVHRIIFLYHHGYLPENGIDHIDRNPLNNRIENLREISKQCNARNCDLSTNNTSGVTGVYFYRKDSKWKAQICINHKVKHVGSFEHFDDAVLARWKKEVELNWDGCNSTSPAYTYLKDNNLLGETK